MTVAEHDWWSKTITFDRPDVLMSMNDRVHWTVQRERTRQWRFAAHVAARNAAVAHLPACMVTVTLPVRGHHRRDPHNYFATVKPIIDGLVDAGCWPDDTPEWVTTTEPHLDRTATVVTINLVAR